MVERVHRVVAEATDGADQTLLLERANVLSEHVASPAFGQVLSAFHFAARDPRPHRFHDRVTLDEAMVDENGQPSWRRPAVHRVRQQVRLHRVLNLPRLQVKAPLHVAWRQRGERGPAAPHMPFVPHSLPRPRIKVVPVAMPCMSGIADDGCARPEAQSVTDSDDPRKEPPVLVPDEIGHVVVQARLAHQRGRDSARRERVHSVLAVEPGARVTVESVRRPRFAFASETVMHFAGKGH